MRAGTVAVGIAAGFAMMVATACTGATPAHAGLVARLTIATTRAAKAEDIDVNVVVTNEGDKPIIVPTQVLGSATLLLKVLDAHRKRMAPGPPPVPTMETTTFAPADHRTFSLRLPAFSPPLAPGDYTVVAAGDVASEAVRFTIAP